MEKDIRRRGRSILNNPDHPKAGRISPVILTIAAAFSIGLFFFYLKYVPQIAKFQACLLPVLISVFVLTVARLEWGTLFFLFALPLINGLPYFFGINENVPHAPTALVLFLFYLLAWLCRLSFSRISLSAPHPAFRPMILLALLILSSTLITIFRYTNFFPFLSDSVYELTTNVNRVTAGGAIMSSVFNGLNYLTGFLFFFILLQITWTKPLLQKSLAIMLSSTLLALGFGIYQLFVNPNAGNTRLRVLIHTLNATFKDPNSFAAYLAAIVPILMGIIFYYKRWLKTTPLVLLVAGLFILPYTGSLGALAGTFVSVIFFLFLLFKKRLSDKKTEPGMLKNTVLSLAALLMIALVAAGIILSSPESKSFSKLKEKTAMLRKGFSLSSFTSYRLPYFWEMAWRMTGDYPLTGVGIGAYIIELPNYAHLHNKGMRLSDSAENYFFQAGAELGLVALALAFWLFWEIGKQIRKTLGHHHFKDRGIFLAAGISAGIVSLFVNFLLHSFIGSFEIIYTFWYLVALVSILDARRSEEARRLFPTKASKAATLSLLMLFSGASLWVSTHSLSLKTRSEQLGLKQDFGMYKMEKTPEGQVFRWTGNHGGQSIKIDKSILEIPLLASHPDIRKHPVKVRFYLNKNFFSQKKSLGEVLLEEPTWKIGTFDVSADIGEEAILLLKVSRTWNPLKTQGSPDPRNLGVAVGKIRQKDKR